MSRIVTDFFEVSTTVLGRGAIGTVFLGKSKEGGNLVAVKIIEKTSTAKHVCDLNQVEILKLVDHEHIIQLIDFFETDSHIAIVLEL
jgi:serine/threonine-protein kinase ULK3